MAGEMRVALPVRRNVLRIAEIASSDAIRLASLCSSVLADELRVT